MTFHPALRTVEQLVRHRKTLASAAGALLVVGSATPAMASPSSSARGSATPVNTVVSCQSFDGPLRLKTSAGRVVTLSSDSRGVLAKGLITRYSYIQRGGPDSGQTVTTTYPGPKRNLVECSVLSGPEYYTLSLLSRP